MLTIEVIANGDFDPDLRDRTTLEEGSLTIGRGKDNDLVLLDPTGAISRQHCRVESLDEGFVLTDTSTNGVFLNAHREAVGRGNTVPLNDGDTISIGHFQLRIMLSGSQATPELHPTDALRSSQQDTFQPPSNQELDAFLTTAAEDESLKEFEVADPAPWPSAPHRVESEDPLAQVRQGDVTEDPFSPFEPVPENHIPEDWDDGKIALPQPDDAGLRQKTDSLNAERPDGDPIADFPEPAAAECEFVACAEAESAAGTASDLPFPGELQNGRDESVSFPEPQSGPSQSSHQTGFDAFLEGADLVNGQLRGTDPEDALRLIGQMYREVIGGLRGLLEARRVIKNELKMSQTIIQQTGNNPLKWSLSNEDAMVSLLDRDQKGRLPPIESIQEAFDDLNAHHIAMVGGMQRAIMFLLKRFDPKALEAKMEASSAVGKLMPGVKSRCWEEFLKLYEEIAREAEDDFDGLFGREFGLAYKDHVEHVRGRSDDKPAKRQEFKGED